MAIPRTTATALPTCDLCLSFALITGPLHHGFRLRDLQYLPGCPHGPILESPGAPEVEAMCTRNKCPFDRVADLNRHVLGCELESAWPTVTWTVAALVKND